MAAQRKLLPFIKISKKLMNDLMAKKSLSSTNFKAVHNIKDKNSISSLVILRSFDLCPENSSVVNIFFDLRWCYNCGR